MSFKISDLKFKMRRNSDALLPVGHRVSTANPRFPVPGLRSHGNFLLQALLGLTLIIAFMPMLARRLATQVRNADMVATVSQMESAAVAARIFFRERTNEIPYGVSILKGDNFADVLEPYGLPLGFVARTPLGQDISLVLMKNDGGNTAALLRISDGKASRKTRAELAARIGFWAANASGPESITAANGEWTLDLSEFGYAPDVTTVYIRIPEETDFSELVQKRAAHPAGNKFLTNLDMGGFSMRNAGGILAQTGKFNTAAADNFVLLGVEDGRKLKNKFGILTGTKAMFQDGAGASALSINRGILTAETLATRTISGFGDAGNLNVDVMSVFDFALAAGRSSFVGPGEWDIRENMVTSNITLDLERLEIGSFINASRGQDVYVDEYELSYNVKSGIEAGTVIATNITVRDQISSALATGATGAVLLDVRVSGTSVLPDAWVTGIDNNLMEIIADPADSSGGLTDCKNIVGAYSGRAGVFIAYNQQSLTQNILCRYVFWHRLEKRIEIKKCLLEGGRNCL